MEKNQLTIELTQEQTNKFNTWKKTFKNKDYLGMVGGHFGLEIIFTSIGDIIKGKSWNGQEIDLTEYENW
jgi:hypothetical protein